MIKHTCKICGVFMAIPWKSGICTHCSWHLGEGYTEEEIKKLLEDNKNA